MHTGNVSALRHIQCSSLNCLIKEFVRWVHVASLFHNCNLLLFGKQWGIALSVSVFHHKDGNDEEENGDYQKTADRHEDVRHNVVGIAEG